MKTKASIIGALVILCLVFAVSAVDALLSPTVVKVEPTSQTVAPGGSFSVDVYVEDVTNMAADGAILHFDPSAMEATGITAGVITTFPIEDINNVAGTVTFGYARMTGSFTGSGPLATIEFTTNASAEGTFNLNLTDVELLRPDLSEIPTEVFDGTVSIDGTPPTVEILSPQTCTWFDSEPVIVVFHPWDNVDLELNYTIFVDGVEEKSGTAPNCTETEVNLGVLEECDHVIKVEVTDDAGFTGSDNVTIHVDRTPPTVEILSPENCTWFDSENVTVKFHPWDNKAERLYYTVYVDGIPYDEGMAPNCTETEVDLGVLEECHHVIKVVVKDYAGKKGFDNVTIHVDLYPPIVEIISPAWERTYASMCVRLNFTAEDTGECPSGIAEMYYVLDGGASVFIEGNVTVSPLDDGWHCITVSVVDGVDKEGTDEVCFGVCIADIDGDGRVYLSDLLLLAQAYNSKPGAANWNPDADLNCDDWVYTADLLILAQNYNKQCPGPAD